MRFPFFILAIALSAASLLICTSTTAARSVDTVWTEDMTWPEIKTALAAGKTTIIIPTGGTEQNGPHIVLGKHNFILKYTAMAIAQRLGNALVAPILPYVPEGNITPPEGHMHFPGTLSIRPETFAAVLEDAARSYKQHGFKLICFVGEHGASQPVQQAVADRLDAEWKSEGVRVLQVSHYYDEHNGQVEWAHKYNIDDPDIEAHGGLADTSEMLAAHPQGVRDNLRAAHTSADMQTVGAGGSSLLATRELGAEFIELKIRGAVAQIQEFSAAK